MNFGQGSIGFVNKIPAPAPATVTDANNGLSLDGTVVQLGQDVGAVGSPAALLNDREIPLSGFYLDFLGNLLSVNIDDAAALFKVYNGASKFLLIDAANNNFEIGDIDGVNNATLLQIDDANQIAQIEFGAGNQYLYIDPQNSTYWLGDIPGVIDSTYFYLDNIGVEISSNGRSVLDSDISTERVRVGANTGGNGTYIEIDDSLAEQYIWMKAANGIKTTGPSGAGSEGLWKLGKVVAGAVALDAANYVEVMIEGVVKKLLIAA